LRNFAAVISKAKTACEVSVQAVLDHLVDVNKTIQMQADCDPSAEWIVDP
jgi:DNA-damage-inducible protein D